ncbi:LPS assembly lipoprotein LptE [Chitinimonas viridis]|uniref:LPS-assembly lipoprotein LptE n=1 Tax=Chitinimonas viridis TaxID=664880 RepID=A0ABT8BAF7_9NEIS|nr:LPS assembly lipoprotein LptE [Chitinimonas viridis]MDN3578581.1 LPS assembly lipoprotein LptE [Chitinimonas viridis]
MTPRLLIPAGLALLLSACGFHLRGLGATTPLAFASLNVTAPAGGLGDVLGRQLSLRPDLKLLAAKEAEAVLAVENEAMDKQILTVNKSGRVTEYQLIYRARFSLRQGAVERIPSTELTLRRDYSFDENNVLGKEAEEQILVRDMRSDAAQQIIRRLAALKPAAAPYTPVPAAQ